MNANKFYMEGFADFGGGIFDYHHGAVFEMTNALAFVRAFFGDFEIAFFAREKFGADGEDEIVNVKSGDFFGGGDFDEIIVESEDNSLFGFGVF